MRDYDFINLLVTITIYYQPLLGLTWPYRGRITGHIVPHRELAVVLDVRRVLRHSGHSIAHMRAWRSLSRRLPHSQCRCLSSTPLTCSAPQAVPARSDAGSNAFAHTMLLPKTAFPLRRDPDKEEALKARTCEGLYNWQVRPNIGRARHLLTHMHKVVESCQRPAIRLPRWPAVREWRSAYG